MRGFKNWLRRFMEGRYGTDKLNMCILWTGVGCSVLAILIPLPPVSLTLSILAYVLMFLALVRTFSRNTYRRYQENRKFLLLLDRIRDRKHRYFTCPNCHQPVRVPRGKGKIAITCPNCREKFIRKS